MISKKDKEELIGLYNKHSKHGQYQLLPDFIKIALDINQKTTINRYEEERFNFINKHLSLNGKAVLDIGGNQGFFSYKALSEGALSVSLVEGNVEHSQFVAKVADIFGLNINTKNDYYSFEDDGASFDIVFLLNVLHHLGDDFGVTDNIQQLKLQIIRSLNALANRTSYLVFQLGFCWKGNPALPIFENGTKSEMIEFIKRGTAAFWEVKNIGVPVKHGERIEYSEPCETNLERRDDWGEFLNRPLMIMKSKMFKANN